MAAKRKGKGAAGYNAPLTDAQEAAIWTLAEEGKSQRGIAEELRLAPSTVGKVLARDPVRLDALRARLREERAQRWKQLETRSIDLALRWVDRTDKVVRKGKLSGADYDRLGTSFPRLLSSLTRAGEAGAKMTQLLTGGATERIGGEQSAGLDSMTNEQLIDAYIGLGRVDELPPVLQALARKEIERRAAPGPQG